MTQPTTLKSSLEGGKVVFLEGIGASVELGYLLILERVVVAMLTFSGCGGNEG